MPVSAANLALIVHRVGRPLIELLDPLDHFGGRLRIDPQIPAAELQAEMRQRAEGDAAGDPAVLPQPVGDHHRVAVLLERLRHVESRRLVSSVRQALEVDDEVMVLVDVARPAGARAGAELHPHRRRERIQALRAQQRRPRLPASACSSSLIGHAGGVDPPSVRRLHRVTPAPWRRFAT